MTALVYIVVFACGVAVTIFAAFLFSIHRRVSFLEQFITQRSTSTSTEVVVSPKD